MDLSNLNEEQKQVVLHDKGPLLVIAGAGTGKTKTITSRILHLLEQGVNESSILALTFTEKATQEMQERVESTLKLGHEELSIKTFHSFCDSVLREKAHEMGLSSSYKLLDQMNQWLFMKKNLFKFELDYYRPLGNPSKFIWDLLNHFSRLKDENVSPEAYLKYAQSMPCADEAKEEAAKKTEELARVYSQYQEALIEQNAMDFGDLTFYALKLFEEHPSVLSEYQNRYEYILVDEFQDTNYTQSRLVFALSARHKNILVVGDDDQSIYKWRGASLSNILHFEKAFPEARRVVLKQNYRCKQNILDASYALIQNNNPDRLEVREKINKKLIGVNGGGEKVKIIHFKAVEEEVAFAADKIRKLKEAEESLLFNDFAVLARTNAVALAYGELFKSLDIPYQMKSPRGFFRSKIVRDILALFKLMLDNDNDVALFRLLSMPVFDLSEEFLQGKLALARKESKSLFDVFKDMLNSGGKTLPGMEESYAKLFDFLDALKTRIYKQSVGQSIYQFLESLELVEYLQDSDSSENIESFEQLSTLSRIVAQFDSEHFDASPKDFLEYIELLEEADMRFDVDKDFEQNAVQILTVHSAKGLEFKHVFVGSLAQQRFPGRKMSEPFSIPDELLSEIFPEKDSFIEEERRLLYVAMTRAKEQLFLSYSDYYAGKKQWKPSIFINEIKDLEAVEYVEYPIVNLRLKAEPSSKEMPMSARPPRSIKRFSYSQFDTFQKCPLKYKFQYVFKLSPPPSHASQFGSSVHNTLNEFYQVIKAGKEVDLNLLKELYERNWLPYGYSSKAHQATRKKKGWEMLEEFYEKNSKPWVVPSFLERPFSLSFGPAVISGRIDRIDRLEDGSYEVIDYKTGKSKIGTSLKKDLQLGLYALACKEIFDINVSKLSLYFLDDNVEDSISVDDLKLSEIKDSLEQLCSEIPQSDFKATPGFVCQFCDYRLVCKASEAKIA